MNKFSPLIVILICMTFYIGTSNSAFAAICWPPSTVIPEGCTKCGCDKKIGECQKGCLCVSDAETGSPDKPETTIGHVTEEFSKHREWMVKMFFNDAEEGNAPGLLAAMQLMTTQLTTNAMQQVQVIGTFFDAKHQLEMQRLFQTLKLRAHKDYHPSEGLCEVGSISRSLNASARNANLTNSALSRRMIERQVMAKDTVANKAAESDQDNRLVNFIKTYCNKLDDNKNLDLLCKKGNPDSENINKDINYTSTIDSALTLDIDFSGTASTPTIDEKAVMALSNNLFSHKLMPFTSANKFVRKNGKPSIEASEQVYMDYRALTAKRSVAQNSFTAITALKTKGDAGSQPFIYALLKEMGGDAITAEEIKREIGEQPSYYAQMDILTKKLYQRPEFYSDLYDKPANVLRKDVAIQAATLMQKRDLYQSYLRSEMTLAVMLETLLVKEQDAVKNNMGGMK